MTKKVEVPQVEVPQVEVPQVEVPQVEVKVLTLNEEIAQRKEQMKQAFLIKQQKEFEEFEKKQDAIILAQVQKEKEQKEKEEKEQKAFEEIFKHVDAFLALCINKYGDLAGRAIHQRINEKVTIVKVTKSKGDNTTKSKKVELYNGIFDLMKLGVFCFKNNIDEEEQKAIFNQAFINKGYDATNDAKFIENRRKSIMNEVSQPTYKANLVASSINELPKEENKEENEQK